jgi:hypothetical protein
MVLSIAYDCIDHLSDLLKLTSNTICNNKRKDQENCSKKHIEAVRRSKMEII